MSRSAGRSPPPPAVPLGALLREWSAARRLSQLALALEADVSARHLSYIETGKTQPSRDLVMRLADALEMPLRERNALLMAAGYAPRYAETKLETPVMTQVRRAIDLILDKQEPYPAFLLDRHWNIVTTNRAAARIDEFLRPGRSGAHRNMLRRFFDPDDLRAAVVNWEEVAGDLLRHLHDDVAAAPTDDAARVLLEEMLAYPDVPTRWRIREVDSPLLSCSRWCSDATTVSCTSSPRSRRPPHLATSRSRSCASNARSPRMKRRWRSAECSQTRARRIDPPQCPDANASANSNLVALLALPRLGKRCLRERRTTRSSWRRTGRNVSIPAVYLTLERRWRRMGW
jgi:transcriptional regulator with XRE-family HTH domain